MSSFQNEAINYSPCRDENISGSQILKHKEEKSGSFFSPFFNDEKKPEKKIIEDIYLSEEDSEYSVGGDNYLFGQEHKKRNNDENLEIIYRNLNTSTENLNVSKEIINLNTFYEEEELFLSKKLEKIENNSYNKRINKIDDNNETSILSNNSNFFTIVNHFDLNSSPHKDELKFNPVFSCKDLIKIFQKKFEKLNKNFFLNFFKNNPLKDKNRYENFIKYFNEEKEYAKVNKMLKNVPDNYFQTFFLYYMSYNEKISEIIKPLLNYDTNNILHDNPKTILLSNKNENDEKNPIHIKTRSTFTDIKKKIEKAKSTLNEKERKSIILSKKNNPNCEHENIIRERSREKSKNINLSDESILIDHKIEEIKECIGKVNKIDYFNKLQDLVGITRALFIRDSFEKSKSQRIKLFSGSKYVVLYETKHKKDSQKLEDYKLSYKVYKRSKS
jgi:hypothetical protein